MAGFRRTIQLLAGAVMLAGSAVLAAPSASSAAATGSGCIAHRPLYVEDSFEVQYSAGCSGHDEPELDPISTVPGSARNLTWTVILPRDGKFEVSSVGPTFWFGGTVSDPNSLFGQAFVELQFYPDAVVRECTPNGGFTLAHVPNAYTACSPVWSLRSTGTKGVFHEPAAFNGMLTRSGTREPLVMHAGDTVTVHFHDTAAHDGWHETVADLTTHQSGTIVLNSRRAGGPLEPAFNTQRIGNSLAWGAVHGAPNSFVWEIGHTSPFTHPAAQFCIPGQQGCYSYDAPAWRGFTPLRILGVRFGSGGSARHWGVVSDFGGKAEILGRTNSSHCSGYGGPFCIYPWFATTAGGGWHYGVDYPDTVADFGRADQFPQTTRCGGPFGPNTTYCSNVVK
jgi:hypothetical protein